MSDASDCAKSISAMVKEWTRPVLAGGINIPPNLIDRRMARFEPSPALAALAMRERAASEIDCGGCNGDCPMPNVCCSADAAAIRALPTTFTDAELLAASRQLPEVQALEEKAQNMLALVDNYTGLRGKIYRDEVDRIWREFRTALAPFMKGAS